MSLKSRGSSFCLSLTKKDNEHQGKVTDNRVMGTESMGDVVIRRPVPCKDPLRQHEDLTAALNDLKCPNTITQVELRMSKSVS